MTTTHATEFNEGVRRLAQYRPFDHGGEGLQAVLRDLALFAAELNGGGFPDLVACQAGFRDLWGLDVEVDEIRTARDTLILQELADKTAGGFALTERAREDLRQRAEDSERTETTALEQWEKDVRELRPDLTPEDIECLREDLRAWLSKIVARHGAEAALMLYPEYERAHQLFEEIETFSTGFLPRRSKAAMAIRDDALKLFVRRASPERRTFLANRLNTAFYLTVLTLDPAAKKLAEAKARGTRIYLDTNFLYAVLGMAGADEVYAAERLLKLTADLGYEIAITPWTVEELRTSIERARRNVEIHGHPFNAGLAQLMVQVTGEKGFTRSYWNAFLKDNITPKDFFQRVAAFEDDLPRLGIMVADEGCKKIEDSVELVRDYSSLLGKFVDRDRHVIEHDAKHRLLIERARGSGNSRFSTAKCWFLTQDTKLPTYAALVPDIEHDEPPKLPFCISPSSWVQIVRAMTPRTDDFDQMVVELLASPYVGYRGPVNQQAVSEVVARMDQYKDASPELALSVVQDSALMDAVAKADPEEVGKQVERAYSTKAKELQEQATDSARIASESQLARQKAEERERLTREDLEAEVRRRESVESDLKRVRREHEEDRRKLAEQLDQETAERDAAIAKERKQREALTDRYDADTARRQRNRRVTGGAVLAALGLGGAAVVLAAGLVTATWPVIAVTVGGALILAVGINVMLGIQWAGVVLTVFAFVLGVAAVAVPPLLPK